MGGVLATVAPGPPANRAYAVASKFEVAAAFWCKTSSKVTQRFLVLFLVRRRGNGVHQGRGILLEVVEHQAPLLVLIDVVVLQQQAQVRFFFPDGYCFGHLRFFGRSQHHQLVDLREVNLFALVFQRDELLWLFHRTLLFLDLLKVLLDTIWVDQALLQVLASIVHGKAGGHFLLDLDHVVEDLDGEVFVSLEVDCRVLGHTVEARFSEARTTLVQS